MISLASATFSGPDSPASSSSRCKSEMVKSSKLIPPLNPLRRRPPALAVRSNLGRGPPRLSLSPSDAESPTPSPCLGLYSPLNILLRRSIRPIPPDSPDPTPRPPVLVIDVLLASASGLVCSLMKALNSCGANSGCKLAGSQNKS